MSKSESFTPLRREVRPAKTLAQKNEAELFMLAMGTELFVTFLIVVTLMAYGR